MHRTAEYGIAAHWLFKEGRTRDELDRHLAWFRQLLELQQDAHSPEEFLEFLKIDLYQDEIFVFTPRGDVKRLPKRSEEHTSELQSPDHLVCRLLLEKKKKQTQTAKQLRSNSKAIS